MPKRKAKTISLPNNLWNFLQNTFKKPQIQTTNVLINGKLITCVILSIVSAFIDIVFFSNLSKSFYDLFGFIAIPAGLLMSVMSIGFSLGKFFVAMQLAALAELKTRLHGFGYTWAKNLSKPQIKWNIIHKLLISLSIITSISLSVISIGAALTRNRTVAQQITEDLNQVNRYINIGLVNEDTQIRGVAESITNSQRAISAAESAADQFQQTLQEYLNDRTEYASEYTNWLRQQTPEFISENSINTNVIDYGSLLFSYKGTIADSYWDQENRRIDGLLSGTGVRRADIVNNRISIANAIATIRRSYEDTYSNTNYADLSELTTQSQERLRSLIRGLNNKYTHPGQSEYVAFDENDAYRAKSTLELLKLEYEIDDGDVGSSARLPMMIGNWIDGRRKVTSVEQVLDQNSASSFGTTEIILMAFIMFSGVLCEFLIALFTPKAVINRKMLSQFNQYFNMQEFDLNRFMLKTIKDYLDIGILTPEQFEEEAKECVYLAENTVDDIFNKYSRKNKDLSVQKVVRSQPKAAIVQPSVAVNSVAPVNNANFTLNKKQQGYSNKVTQSVQEIENLLKN